MAQQAPRTEAALDRLVPVTVVTGYLGSGKSSFINRLLGAGLLADAAFVVNEFGQIPIDHMLIETPQEAIAITTQGCLCCAVGDDLEQTLQNLFMKRLRGVIPDFRTLVIETSGLDSPGPVLETLFSPRVVRKNYWFAGVVTVADALNLAETIEDAPEAAAQLAVADLVALSKTDLASPRQIGAMQALLAEAAPSAHVETVQQLAREPAPLVRRGLMVEPGDLSACALGLKRDSPKPAPVHAHAHGIDSVAYRFRDPVEWRRLGDIFRRLEISIGSALLRAKGIVALAGFDRPASVQAVRGQLYPPEFLAPSPRQREGHLVFIGRHLPLAELDAAMEQCGASRVHPHQHEGAT